MHLRTLVVLLLLLLLCTVANAERAFRGLTIRFFAAGHANAALVSMPSGRQLLIDAGRGDAAQLRDNLVTRRILPLLESRGIRRLEAFLITHPHWDHTGDPKRLARHVSIGAIYTNSDGLDWLGGELRALAPVKVLARGDQLAFDGLQIAVLWPPRRLLRAATDHLSAINNRSLVLRLTYGQRRFLLAADLAFAGEARLLRLAGRAAHGDRREELRADLLQLGHHGVLSTSARWLAAVSPRFAIASCGQRWSGRIDHLSRALFRRLKKRRVRLYRTDRDGDVLVQTDGRMLLRVFSSRAAR